MPQPRTLRLMTFNIAHGRGLSLYQGFHSERGIQKNLRKIADVLKENNVDMIAMQEVDEDSHWNRNINLLQYICDHTDLDYTAMGINTRRPGPKPLKYGNAILSRYPLVSWESMPFGSATLGEKGFLYVEAKVKEEIVCLVNLHLDYRSKQRRVEQIEKLIDWLRDRKHPGFDNKKLAPIVCGDFNSQSKTAGDAVRHLFDYLHQEEHGHYTVYPRDARTFPTYWPSTGIDFVILPEPYRKVRCEVIRSFVSDHRPVLLEFTY
jgi:endonuclease/exonuclease/phosphatase family metal-dependent hydrolase